MDTIPEEDHTIPEDHQKVKKFFHPGTSAEAVKARCKLVDELQQMQEKDQNFLLVMILKYKSVQVIRTGLIDWVEFNIP